MFVNRPQISAKQQQREKILQKNQSQSLQMQEISQINQIQRLIQEINIEKTYISQQLQKFQSSQTSSTQSQVHNACMVLLYQQNENRHKKHEKIIKKQQKRMIQIEETIKEMTKMIKDMSIRSKSLKNEIYLNQSQLNEINERKKEKIFVENLVNEERTLINNIYLRLKKMQQKNDKEVECYEQLSIRQSQILGIIESQQLNEKNKLEEKYKKMVLESNKIRQEISEKDKLLTCVIENKIVHLSLVSANLLHLSQVLLQCQQKTVQQKKIIEQLEIQIGNQQQLVKYRYIFQKQKKNYKKKFLYSQRQQEDTEINQRQYESAYEKIRIYNRKNLTKN